jgi:hypothetical protein
VENDRLMLLLVSQDYGKVIYIMLEKLFTNIIIIHLDILIRDIENILSEHDQRYHDTKLEYT